MTTDNALIRTDQPTPTIDVRRSPQNGPMGSPRGEQPEKEESPVIKFHRIMRGRYKWAILLALVAGSIGAFVGYISEEEEYRSSGLISVEPQLDPYLFRGVEDTSPMPMFASFMSAQTQVIKSRRVVDKSMRSDAWQQVSKAVGDQAVSEFQRALRVGHSGQIIQISFTDTDPRTAMRGVQSVVNAYMEIYGERDQIEDAKRLQALEDRRTKLNSEAKSVDKRISALAHIYGTDDLTPLYDVKLKESNKNEVALNDVNRKVATAKALLGAGESVDATVVEYTPEEIAVYNPRMSELLNQQRGLEQRKEQLSIDYGPTHRVVKENAKLLTLVEKRIETEADEFRRGGAATMSADGVNRLTLARLEDQLENLREIYEKSKAELLDLGHTKYAIEQLKREKGQIASRLSQTKSRIDALTFELAGRNRVEVIDPGNWPVRPERDGRRKKATMGLGFGCMVGFGLVFLFGLTNQRYRYLDDAKSSVGSVRILGILPKLPEDLCHPEHAAIAAHCVHQIRTLLQIGRADESQALSVTSPAAGDGKTSLALALGLSFAASGCRTLLVDCDIIGGGLTQRLDVIVHRRLGQLLMDDGLLAEAQLAEAVEAAETSNRQIGEILVELGYVKQHDVQRLLEEQVHTRMGLIDVLQSDPLEFCVAETGMSNLSLLPLGAADIRDIGKLSPVGIRRVLKQAKEQYDVVLFDTGPSPGSLEASLVASEVDGVVITVSRGEQRQMAEAAVKHLQSLGANVGGIVFNRAETRDVEIYGSTSRVSARSGSLNLEPFEDLQVGDPTEKSRYGPVAYVTARSLPENYGTDRDRRHRRRGGNTVDTQALPEQPERDPNRDDLSDDL